MNRTLRVSWILAAVMLVAIAVGAAAADKTEISVAFWGVTDCFPPGVADKVYEQVQKDLNITIKPIPYGWNDYEQKSSVWAAANDIPDVLAAFPRLSVAAEWAREGVLKFIPQDLSKYPYLKKYVDNPDKELLMLDGKMFAIPRYQALDMTYSYDQTSLVAHKDIYQSLKLKKFPETMDELKSMLRAIKAKYPTITPLVFWNFDGPQLLMHNYTLTRGSGLRGWVKEDGRYIPGFFSRQTPKAVKVFRELVAEELVDKDIIIQANSDAGRIKWLNKEGAVMTASPMPNHWVQNYEQYKAKWGTNVYDNMVWGQDPANAEGKNYFDQGLFWAESFFSSKLSDQKMDRILALYDYLLSPKGLDLCRYGMEGTDFTRKGNKVTITRQKEADGKTFTAVSTLYPSTGLFTQLVQSGEDFPFYDTTFDPNLLKFANDYISWKKTKAVPTPGYNNRLDTLSTPSKDKFAIDNRGELYKLFFSTGDLDKEWNEVVQKYKKAGLDQMIDEVNKLGKERGLIK